MNDTPEQDAGRARGRAGPAVPAGYAGKATSADEGTPRAGGPAPRVPPAGGGLRPADRTPGMLANPWVRQFAGTGRPGQPMPSVSPGPSGDTGQAGTTQVQPPRGAQPPDAAQRAGDWIDAGQAPPGARPRQAGQEREDSSS